MKPYVLLCFFLLLCTCVRAQTINGQLTDGASGAPLGFANVSVYDGTDNLVKGTSSDADGRFTIGGLATGEYRLEASFLGYATQTRSVTLTAGQPVVELPAIVLEEGGNDLDEVTVTAERAVMELGLDRKVFNVEKSLAAAGGNAEDLLREIPSVTVDLDGNVSLRGSGGVRFLINGKPSALTQQASFLQTLTAANIERVEVLTNPGAQFDPEGTAGLINIVLKQKREDGFNATVSLNAGTGNKFDGSADANWRLGKFNTTFGVNGRYDERFFRGSREQTAVLADTSYRRSFGFDGLRQNQSQGFNLGTEYALTQRSSIAVSGNYRWGEGESSNLRTTDFFSGDGVLDRSSVRSEAEPQEDENYEVRADYQTTFAKPGRSLSAGFQFSESSRSEVENYEETIRSSDGLFLGENRQNAPADNDRTQYLGQLDYSQTIREDFKLEAGWRSTLQRLDNVADFNVLRRRPGRLLQGRLQQQPLPLRRGRARRLRHLRGQTGQVHLQRRAAGRAGVHHQRTGGAHRGSIHQRLLQGVPQYLPGLRGERQRHPPGQLLPPRQPPARPRPEPLRGPGRPAEPPDR